jgi:hypothetical protein
MNEKAAQEHEYTQNIKRMELNHIDMIEELKAIFDKKSSIDNANYLTLEQKKIEMEQSYIKKLKEMEEKNQKIVEELEAKFTAQINETVIKIEDSK